MTIAESIQLNKERIARAFGVPVHMLADPDRTAVPRYWSLCMTSENHGTVGKAGDMFSHAPGKHERVLVVEVPTPANAPIDRVDLRVLTGTGAARPPMGELVFGARTQHAVGKTVEETVEVPAQWLRNLAQLRPEAYSHDGLVAVTRAFCDTADDYSAGIPPVFAIAPATTGASTARPDWLEYDPADHILTIYGVKYSADLFSGLGLGPVGMSFTILAREDGALTLCRGPVAAQAGQVEVPEGFVLIPEDAPAALIVAIEREVESQLDASGISRADMCRLDGSEIFDALFEAATQASTSGERQEGGAS